MNVTALYFSPTGDGWDNLARDEWFLDHLKPEDFDYLTYYENSTYSKPNPKYFKSLLEKFNLKPEEVVLFGNNTLEDGDCSAACGIRCFLVKGNIIYDPKAMGSYPEISMSEVIPTMESLLTE